MLRIKVVNKRKNKQFLANVPHRDFLDLSIIYYITCAEEEGVLASVTIKNEHAENLKISEKELHEAAINNQIRLEKPVCENILHTLLKTAPENLPEELLADMVNHPTPIYILSNQNHHFGAGLITSNYILKKLAEDLGDNLIIIPSSTDEVIIMPKSIIPDVSDIKEMVPDVNANELPPEMILSDSVYYYNKDNEELSILEEN